MNKDEDFSILAQYTSIPYMSSHDKCKIYLFQYKKLYLLSRFSGKVDSSIILNKRIFMKLFKKQIKLKIGLQSLSGDYMNIFQYFSRYEKTYKQYTYVHKYTLIKCSTPTLRYNFSFYRN